MNLTSYTVYMDRIHDELEPQEILVSKSLYSAVMYATNAYNATIDNKEMFDIFIIQTTVTGGQYSGFKVKYNCYDYDGTECGEVRMSELLKRHRTNCLR
ncbi:hypothetical protein MOD25_05510 [Bacillus haynesii]|uniref:hypothetical protein n=1 Tax=Bacillus haynesii TaxID=1925021 RepID=UPI0022822756|nr:hypothetical protein [Bacillus haynesii]MCY8549358.1 hypothetical protein [Bacillus haynesii]